MAKAQIKGVYTYPNYILRFNEYGQADVTANLSRFTKEFKVEVVAGPAAG